MFTGLIKAVGKVRPSNKGLALEGCDLLAPLDLGESISVDGVCLTVANVFSDGFLADVSEETLERTTLGIKAKRGGHVNLEPAIRLSDRLGGHLVSGHVDGLGEVVSIEKKTNSWHVELRWQEISFARFICEKASISVDGISLTIAGCKEEGLVFWIAVIPHTFSNTTLQYLAVGDLVNLEVDLLAKYVESLLNSGSKNLSEGGSAGSPSISREWLASQGWS